MGIEKDKNLPPFIPTAVIGIAPIEVKKPALLFLPLFKKCSKCGEIKEISEFNKDKKGKYGKRAECKKCESKSKKKKPREKMTVRSGFHFGYTLMLGCENPNCTNDIPMGAQYHHNNEETKEDELNEMIKLKIKELLTVYKEVRKCTCLCAKCHQILHAMGNDNAFFKHFKATGQPWTEYLDWLYRLVLTKKADYEK